nr:flotillin family protein [Acinetobacter sp.]
AAETDAISITVAAEASKQAAVDDAEAVRTAAEAEAEKVRLKAKGEADAKILLAQAQEKQYQVDAEGTRAVNEANNILSSEQVEMQIRLALLKYLPEIIRESVKPMENIDDIKILQVNGLGGLSGSTASVDGGEQGQVALSDQVVNSALRYRSQAPLIDSLMNELGIQGGDINGLTQSLKPKAQND